MLPVLARSLITEKTWLRNWRKLRADQAAQYRKIYPATTAVQSMISDYFSCTCSQASFLPSSQSCRQRGADCDFTLPQTPWRCNPFPCACYVTYRRKSNDLCCAHIALAQMALTSCTFPALISARLGTTSTDNPLYRP